MPDPVVQTNPATLIGVNGARLNGEILSLGSLAALEVSFEYGLVSGVPYPHSTPPETKSGIEAFFADISGLSPGKTYYFKAKGGFWTIAITTDGAAFDISDLGDISISPNGELVVTIEVPDDYVYICSTKIDGDWCGAGSYAWGTRTNGAYVKCSHGGIVTITFTNVTADHTLLIHQEMCE